LSLAWFHRGLSSTRTWQQAYTSLYSENAFKIVFEATTNYNWSAEIRLDDVIITRGWCDDDIIQHEKTLGVKMTSYKGSICGF